MVEKEDIEALLHFRTMASLTTFKEIFGDDLGEHLWHKFRDTFHDDVVLLWSGLDTENQEKLLEHINSTEEGAEGEEEEEEPEGEGEGLGALFG